MFEHLDDHSPPVPGPHERAEVMARAQDVIGRRRLLTGLGIAVAVVLVALIPAVTGNDGKEQSLQTASGAPASQDDAAPNATNPVTGQPLQPGATAKPGTPTTKPPSVLGTQFQRPVITGVPTTAGPAGQGAKPAPAGLGPGAPGATTTTLVCRNSTNPACGPFRWDPAPPPDQPAHMTITATPAQPKAGENVKFNVVIDDPDDPSLDYNFFFWEYGDGPGFGTHGDPPPGGFCEQRYGPWTPPNPGPAGHSEQAAPDHTYASAGTYTVKFSYGPGGPRSCYDPYASPADGALTITVVPA